MYIRVKWVSAVADFGVYMVVFVVLYGIKGGR